MARGRLGSRRRPTRRGRGRNAPAAMPWDSQAERESAELGNEAGDTRASLAADYERFQREAGFGLGADNPYSAAATLKQQRDSNRRGTLNTAGNQIYAGSTINKLRGANRRYDVGYQKLQDQNAQAQAAYQRGLGRTQRDQQQGAAAIKEGALNRKVASEPQPLAAGPGRRSRRRAGLRGRGRQNNSAARRRSRGRL